ncbi:MAG: flagellin FliC3 [Lachnospiraceae bacterium]|nr:flagellin FliC3 [Lachnospiraceae bacterium]
MKVNYNAQAIIANNKLKVNDNKLSESIGRLSTGLKIKNAKDNPSGLAMARRMNAQIEGMGVAGNSAKDGMNIIKTADGVLNEIHDILQRMNELAVKGATSTITPTDRDYIESEIQQLKDEIGRIASTTDFNGQTILDGTFDYRGYATKGSNGETDPDVRVASYSDSLAGKQFKLSGLDVLKFDYDETTQTGTKQLYGVSVPHNVTFDDINNPAANYQMKIVSIDGDLVNLEDDKGNSLSVSIRKDSPDATINLDLTNIGPMTVQIGANEGQVLDMRIPAINLTSLGLFGLSVKSSLNNYASSKEMLTEEEASKKAIDSIKNALTYVSNLRSRLGAYQNRLEHTDANLDTTSENLTASYSQIMDVDMAEEMTNYSTQNVLSQAGISILSQANERASLALQLLQ